MNIIRESYRLPSDFPKRIKLLRQKLGLSQRQFADLVDIFVPLLRQWERGQAQPKEAAGRLVVMEQEGG